MAKSLEPFDKYEYYIRSVQSPDVDVKFLRKTTKKLSGREPTVFREDFCGTHALCCEWVKLDHEYRAIGIDLDPEPIDYGKKNYQPKLSDAQRSHISIFEKNVLSSDLPTADVVAALNFSYFIFKDRATMKQYYQSVFDSLSTDGVFILDCMGGSETQEANEEETEYEDDGYSYFWDQKNFDPISNHAEFAIHFKRKGEKKRHDVFTYDWRMWSIPELRDILAEVGFAETHVYWEGTDKDGDGNGVFTEAEEGEDCEAWVAYIAAVKK